MNRKRLDIVLFERGLCNSREQAKAFTLAGYVWSNGKRLEKAGHPVPTDIPLQVLNTSPRFVSRAGEKLLSALQSFPITTKDRVCLDIGASTGGFTDCLLQNGALHVFAVDVGYGQLDQRLRVDPRVTVAEKTNARYLTLENLLPLNPLAERADLATIDVSFISLKKIIPPLKKAFPLLRDWVLLFKPQFEVERAQVGKKGLVKEEIAVRVALEQFSQFMQVHGFILAGGPQESPLSGKKSGNMEYLFLYAIG